MHSLRVVLRSQEDALTENFHFTRPENTMETKKILCKIINGVALLLHECARKTWWPGTIPAVNHSFHREQRSPTLEVQ